MWGRPDIRKSTEKFIGWPRYSHGMWPNEVYFSSWFLLWSTNFFLRCCIAWIPSVKRSSTSDMMSSCELFSLWYFQPSVMRQISNISFGFSNSGFELRIPSVWTHPSRNKLHYMQIHVTSYKKNILYYLDYKEDLIRELVLPKCVIILSSRKPGCSRKKRLRMKIGILILFETETTNQFYDKCGEKN